MSETSDVVSPVLKYLKKMKELGQILWYSRIWCGTINFHGRYIHGAEDGTPDLFFIKKSGQIIWVECKSNKGKQSKEQQEFQKIIELNTDRSKYVLARTLDDVIKEIE